MTAHSGRGIWMRVIALIAIAFRLLTIREGGAVLFLTARRVRPGSYVPFVLWFNFLAGFASGHRWRRIMDAPALGRMDVDGYRGGNGARIPGLRSACGAGRRLGAAHAHCHDAGHFGVGWHCGHGLASINSACTDHARALSISFQWKPINDNSEPPYKKSPLGRDHCCPARPWRCTGVLVSARS